MQWRCHCHRQEEAEKKEAEKKEADEAQELFKQASRSAGVWEAAERDQAEARSREARDDSSAPDKESVLWACPRCRNMSTVHDLRCRVCSERRPRMQKFRLDLGDWYCPECNNP